MVLDLARRDLNAGMQLRNLGGLLTVRQGQQWKKRKPAECGVTDPKWNLHVHN
jgi:hypothetical protein